MFDLDTSTTVLISLVPALTSVGAIVGGIVNIKNRSKRSERKMMEMMEENNRRLDHNFRDVHIIKQKVTSIENHMLDNDERGRR